jgi:uncharacterized membrane protein YbhN (UPF0104 family)
MLRPIVKDWDGVLTFVRKTNPLTFLVACGIFTIFLFARALTWHRILKGFGHDLPLAPATRIWISSELARYVPGSLLQFAGRVLLAKPYGVPRAVTITSQILELSAILLANVILAVACLLFFAAKIEGRAKVWLVFAVVLLPALSLFLHPKIFDGIVNGLRARRGKDPIVTRLRGRVLTALLFGSLVALVWQSIAIWLLTHEALHLEWQHWWYVAGAYCLAWIAGFLSFLSPGGLGVRELVFYLTLRAILPAHIKNQFGADRETLNAYLRLLALMLRAWTIVGELILWSLSCLADLPGALGRPGAPGRVPIDLPPASPSTRPTASMPAPHPPAAPAAPPRAPASQS